MPKKVVYETKIEFLQILDENGKLDEKLAQNTLSDKDALELYEFMIISREFDDVAFRLQRSGQMGTFPQGKGHEASALGTARAVRKGHDHLVPYYRENPASFWHGLPMHQIYLHWMGDERGNNIDPKLKLNPLSIAIGTQTLHAAGIAWAYKLRKEDRVVVCYFGEGATSEGDFHEALNFASTLKLPVVYVCFNNQYAISVPRSRNCAADTLAQRALAYGMPTIQVDGNDIFAVYKATRDYVEAARAGAGPHFIECLTYRLADHTTADDASRYRPKEEVEEALKKDPMVRLRKYLETKGMWDDKKQAAAQERAKATVRDVVNTAVNIEKPKVDDIFDYTFAELPADLAKQKETLRTDSLGLDPNQLGLQPQQDEQIASH